MAIFKGGKARDDHFTGTAASDRFLFDAAELTAGDVIFGGDAPGIDTLAFTSAGKLAADALANVRGIEKIVLAEGNNAITLSDAVVASATGARVSVQGGSGIDIVDGSALTGANAIDVIAGAGRDTLKGGAGADTFAFTTGNLTSADTVAGGGGIDTLKLLDGGAVTATTTSKVTGIEAIDFATAATRLVLTTAIFAGSSTGTLTVNGGVGNDTIDAQAVSGLNLPAGATLVLNGGSGDDHILGPRAASGFAYYPATIIDGGAGRDTIDVTAPTPARVVYDAHDIHAFVAGSPSLAATLIVNGAASVDLSKKNDQTLADDCITRGFGSVDARGSAVAVSIRGNGSGSIYGGAGSDVLSNATYLEGGAGADVMTGTSDFNGAHFTIREGDFAAGEKILGLTRNDFLLVLGSADLTTGVVTGIRYLDMGRGESGKPNTLVMANDQVKDLWYVSGAGDLVIRAGADHTVALNGLTNFGAPDLKVLVQGTAAADTLSAGSMYELTIHGGGGADVISAHGDTYGDGGNDRIDYSSYGLTDLLDGGEGNDTLTSSTFLDLKIRLADAQDQSLGDHTVMRNFENVDLSAAEGDMDVVGSDRGETLRTGRGVDHIDGGAGNDTIAGGIGEDVLTGGAGADRFELLFAAGMDTITDFTTGEDKLVFAKTTYMDRTIFSYPKGSFDSLVVASDRTTSIAGADLVIYTAATVRSLTDVNTWLRDNHTGDRDHGLFIVAEDKSGHAMLYFTLDASGQNPSFSILADLGTVPIEHIALSDFAFI